jgi:methionyl-tRNA formyltransferase
MRIVLFTTENLYSNLIVEPLFKSDDHQVVAVVKTLGIFPKTNPWKTVWRIVRRYSPAFFAYKIFETLLYRFLVCWDGIPAISRWAEEAGAPVFGVSDINAPSVLEKIRGLRPDAIVSVSTNQRFGSALIKIPPKGCVNIHSSYLPDYRGVAPYFWALVNGEAQTGITAHKIDEEFDTGKILAQKRVAILADDTMHTLFFRCCRVGRGVLAEAVDRVAASAPDMGEEQVGPGSYFSWPTREACRRFRLRGRRFCRIGQFVDSVRRREVYIQNEAASMR